MDNQSSPSAPQPVRFWTLSRLSGAAASRRGTAIGLHQSFYSIGIFGWPWLSGIAADALGIPAMFAIIAVVFSLVILALGIILKKTE